MIVQAEAVMLASFEVSQPYITWPAFNYAAAHVDTAKVLNITAINPGAVFKPDVKKELKLKHMWRAPAVCACPIATVLGHEW